MSPEAMKEGLEELRRFDPVEKVLSLLQATKGFRWDIYI
jgi:hypothetical protein